MATPVPPHPDGGFVSGYFAGLVDFRFTKFIGPRVLSVIYTLAFILVVLVALLFFFSLLSRGGGFAVLAIIIVPIGTLLYLTLIRLGLELYSAILRTAENTSRAAQLLELQLSGRGGQLPPPPAGGYGPPAPYSPPPAPFGPPPGPYGGPPAGPPPGGYGGPPAGPPPGGQYPYGAG